MALRESCIPVELIRVDPNDLPKQSRQPIGQHCGIFVAYPMLCPITTDLSGWYRQMYCSCSLHFISVEQHICSSASVMPGA
jgi:hypothetical protein